MDISQLENKTRDELTQIAKEMGISNYTNLKKQDIIMRLLRHILSNRAISFAVAYWR